MTDKLQDAWLCTVCGYLHYGPEPPHECPQCGAGRGQFKPTTAPSPASADVAAETAVHRYVIVGAGIAGVSAAEAIRKSDPDATIILLSSESELPYFRMNLTRYLAGELDSSKLSLHPMVWYGENRINLQLNTTVTDLLPDEKILILSDERKIPYDTSILATGASPFVPPFPGTKLEGVQTLRTLHDANAILAVCSNPIRVVCIGGGLLGLEVASAIARRGATVTVVESLAWLLPRQLDQPASWILQKKIEAMGFSVFIGARTQALVGETHVRGVQFEDGRLLPADLVVISAGVSANLELARKAGLLVNKGILVDEHMRTSHADIYAAGDDTEHHGRLYGLWVPAKSQGTIAGLSAAGKDATFSADPPSARLKVLGIDLFSIGQLTPQDETDVILSEAQGGNYASFVFHHSVMVGSILLGDVRLASSVKSAVESQTDFSTQLANGLSVTALKQLLK
jgi:nitrite reductase (NADH) large subunit